MAALHTNILPRALGLTGLPRGKIRQTIDRLKSAGRITQGTPGPNSEPVSAHDIARVLLGLSAARAAQNVGKSFL